MFELKDETVNKVKDESAQLDSGNRSVAKQMDNLVTQLKKQDGLIKHELGSSPFEGESAIYEKVTHKFI